MPVFNKGNKQLIFLHIPKTGGQSINKEFAKNDWQVDFLEKRAAFTKITPQHLTYSELDKIFEIKNNLNFTVVREPWERFVSEFVWQTKSVDFNNLNKWADTVLDNPWSLKYDNHFVPQCHYIGNHTQIFKYSSKDILIEFLRKFEPNFKWKYNSNRYYNYELPSIDILSKKCLKKFTDLYQQDYKL